MIDPQSNLAINSRFSARGTYYRWLIQQYGSIPMLELQEDNQDPISLRKIFVPLRLDAEDRDESSINPPEKFHEESEENQLGQDAFEDIIKHDFLVISGRPGAGKTTLIKALINELCGTHSSQFRNRMHKRYGAVFTIPVILRELPDIESVNNLDDLLTQWWGRLGELSQLAFDKKTFTEKLDLVNLKLSLEHDDLQLLILFDGIDEVGSFDLRSKIYQIAQDAKSRGFRTILTGRPSGLADLHNAVKKGVLDHSKHINVSKRKVEDLSSTVGTQLELASTWLDSEDQRDWQTVIDSIPPIDEELNLFISYRSDIEQWRFIQPLTRPQIDLFIKKWYQLDPTWVSKLGTHPEEFKRALADPQRDHLLPLARRPIFLSLMAIVHCTKNEMPHGRAELYKTIVDVYLTRQRKHRRLKQTTTGDNMPQWDSHEPRTALGYLAWRSMHKGSGKEGNEDRRILWKREDLEVELQKALTSALKFSEVTASDAGSLINYYLNPAGLLIEPVEGYIQFAHLSFQEYLCAEYLQGQMSGRRMEKQWKQEVLEHLSSPGWQEVALLLLTVHANKTQNRGHFELISYLDVSIYQQARLMFSSLLGKELPVQAGDRQHWLSLLIMVALVHPKLPEIKYFHLWPDLNDVGLECVSKMLLIFNETDGKAVWQYLMDLKCGDSPLAWQEEYFEDFDSYLDPISKRWATPLKDESWIVEKDTSEAQRYSLLNLIIESRWGGFDPNDADQPLKNKNLQALLSEFYKKSPLWDRKDNKWKIHISYYLLEKCFNRGSIFETVIRNSIPLSMWLLMVENTASASIISSIESKEVISEQRTRLSLAFYQWQQLLEILSFGKGTRVPFKKLMSKSLLKPSSIYLQRRQIVNTRSDDRQRPQIMANLISFLMLSGVRPIAGEQYSSLSKAISDVVSLEPNFLRPNDLGAWYVDNLDLLLQVGKIPNVKDSDKEQLGLLSDMVISAGGNSAAWVWFFQQSESPQLLVNRGGRANEPLPRELGLFNRDGLPHDIQERDHLLNLKEWVWDDENWLSFIFPNEDLTEEVRQLLLSDIAELKQQDWSPYRLLDELVSSWPENEKHRDFSKKSGESRMTNALEEFLAKYPEIDAE